MARAPGGGDPGRAGGPRQVERLDTGGGWAVVGVERRGVADDDLAVEKRAELTEADPGVVGVVHPGHDQHPPGCPVISRSRLYRHVGSLRSGTLRV